MINQTRLRQAISIMERAGKVYMGNWQYNYPAYTDEKTLHHCGTPACFAGWLAVSPEFQNSGGTVASSGAPKFNNYTGAEAIIRWMEATAVDALVLELIIYGKCYVATEDRDRLPIDNLLEEYDVDLGLSLNVPKWLGWKAKDVITTLEVLLND